MGLTHSFCDHWNWPSLPLRNLPWLRSTRHWVFDMIHCRTRTPGGSQLICRPRHHANYGVTWAEPNTSGPAYVFAQKPQLNGMASTVTSNFRRSTLVTFRCTGTS